MARTDARSKLAIVALAVFAVAGCDSSTAAEDPEIAIALSSNQATLGQGASTELTVTIGRTNFKDPVTLSAQGVPAGVTVTFTPAVVPNGIITSTIQVAASSSTVPATSTITVRATGSGVTEQAATFALTVNVTGSYTLSALNPSVRVAQGGAGSTSILINRVDLYGGNVSVAVSGAPSGVTASLSPSPTAGNSSTLSLTATASAPVGTHALSVTSTSPGLPDQATSVSLEVIAPPATTSIAVPTCSGVFPSAWAAYQNEGYGWQQVTPTGNSFNFAATEKVGFAHVTTVVVNTQSGPVNESRLEVYYLTRAELSNFNDRDCAGSKELTGTVAGLSSGQDAVVYMGRVLRTPDFANPGFSLPQLPSRPLDLVASRGVITNDGQFAPDRILLRRGVDLASGSAMPTVDFGTEGFTPTTTNLTISGIGINEEVDVVNRIWTATSTQAILHVNFPISNTVTLASIPVGQLVGSDLHELFTDVYAFSGYPGRGYFTYFAGATDRNETLGPALSNITVSTLVTTPNVRMRGLLPSQTEYNSQSRLIFFQSISSSASRLVTVITTAGYLGGLPATWDIVIPDLSGTAGLNNSWLLGQGQVEWYVDAFSGRPELIMGALPVAGDRINFAYRIGANTALRQFRVASPLDRRLRGRGGYQYLRR